VDRWSGLRDLHLGGLARLVAALTLVSIVERKSALAATDEAKVALQDQWEALLLRVPSDIRHQRGPGSGQARLRWISETTAFPYKLVAFAKRIRDDCAHRRNPSGEDLRRANAIVRALTVLIDELNCAQEKQTSAPGAESPTYLALPMVERARAQGIVAGLKITWFCEECETNTSGSHCYTCGWGSNRPLHSVQFRVPPQIDYGRKIRIRAEKFKGGRLPGGDYYIEVVPT
jgi:hypothetical protein